MSGLLVILIDLRYLNWILGLVFLALGFRCGLEGYLDR